MRIYKNEILAAVAFIACLSKYSASGSKAVRLEVPSHDHLDGHEDDVSDDIAQRNDEAEIEARMQPSSKMVALLKVWEEKLYAIAGSTLGTRDWARFPQLDGDRVAQPVMERIESSGTLSQEPDLSLRVGRGTPELSKTVARTLPQETNHPSSLDLSLRLGKEQAPVVAPHPTIAEVIIKKLQEYAKAGSVRPETWERLKKDVANDNSGDSTLRHVMYSFTKFASALRKAKANGLDVDQANKVEEAMLRLWVDLGVTIDKAFYFLELDKITERGGLTDGNLALFDEFIQLYNMNHRGADARLDSSIRNMFKKNGDELVLAVSQAGKDSDVAVEVLTGFTNRVIHNIATVDSLVEKFLKAEMSESMIRHMLPIFCAYRDTNPSYKKLWDELIKDLQKKLDSGWSNALKDAVSTRRSRRKADTALGIKRASARKKRASKGQKSTGPSIQR